MDLFARGGYVGAAPTGPEIIEVSPEIADFKAKVVLNEPPAAPRRLRVLLAGTHPVGQTNGYSRITYNIAKYLGAHNDIQFTIYGFQKFNQTTAGPDARDDIPAGVILHDAYATEEPKRQGFGEKEFPDFLKAHPQDVVVIFNDLVVTTNIINNLPPGPRDYKLVSYIDQVTPVQKKQFIEIVNQRVDAIIAFTPYWESVLPSLGIKNTMPTYHFPHGFNEKKYFPIPRTLARRYFSLPQDAFIVLNLNRNQPRKRWDHTMMVWSAIVEKHRASKNARPIKLLIATAPNGYWDLLEIYENELRKRGISMDIGREYIIQLARPQQMGDRDINILYNACDIGLNTCEGEGFGLCQFEHLAVRCPQVAPNIGGFREFLHPGNSILIEPKWSYYIDKERDGIGGYAEIGDLADYVAGVWKYFTNPSLVRTHGARGRKEIIQHYAWPVLIDHFRDTLFKIAGSSTLA